MGLVIGAFAVGVVVGMAGLGFAEYTGYVNIKPEKGD